ncbi:MAG TPA: triacylglycerol lipase [Pseudomonadales bacterium]|nr:triacylglycerol lipase [Pseudomonadales bacterium]
MISINLLPRFLGICSLLILLCGSPETKAAPGDNFTATQYPIVLVYGILGFDTVLGVDYFYGIPAALRSGGANVYVANIQQLNRTALRGEQLLAQVQRILAITGASKVNLIGHDQGGLTARYVAAVRPDLVASVITVGTPNKGTPVADLVKSTLQQNSTFEQQASLVINLLGSLISLLSTTPDLTMQNSLGAFDSLTLSGVQSFNQKFPAAVPVTACGEGEPLVNGVRYYSISGTAIRTNASDPSDRLWLAASLAFLFAPNDGFVSRCSSHLGKVIRDNYRMNHFDEVNMLFGMVSDIELDTLSVYRQLAHQLQTDGL